MGDAARDRPRTGHDGDRTPTLFDVFTVDVAADVDVWDVIPGDDWDGDWDGDWSSSRARQLLVERGLLPPVEPELSPAEIVVRDGLANPVRFDTPEDARQVVVVSADEFGTNQVQVTCFAFVDGEWVAEVGPVPGLIGPKGFTADPSELDWYTPVGSYAISHMFGREPDLGFRFPYRRCLADECWVDDPASALYNTFQAGPSEGRWRSAEHLAMYPTAPCWRLTIRDC